MALKASIGDAIFYGNYELDGDISNGTEPIEWIVLDKRDGQLLLLSKYILDYKKYQEEKCDTLTWGSCTLKNWLNNEFYETAFSTAEREFVSIKKIESEYVSNTLLDNRIEDYIFLLSVDEAIKYFGSDLEGNDNALLSQYKKAEDCKGRFSSWWLRSLETNVAAVVWGAGRIDAYGQPIGYSSGVRPAFWLDLE